MTPEDAFVADIREHPDDDAPRLILADWLEDRGESGDADRAEFIRLQCRRAHLQPDSAEELPLRRRAAELLKTHWDDWARPLYELIGKQQTEGWLVGSYQPEALSQFRRGFLDVLDMPARRFLDHGEEILRRAPLRQVRLHGAGAAAGELAACPHLRWLERIDFIDYFRDPVDARGMAALAGSPYLEALRGLGLYRNNLGDAGVEALAGAKWLPGLVVLDLGDNGVSAEGVRALAQTPYAFRPQRLRLGSNPIGDLGVAALAASPVASRLTTLSLTRCNLGPESARPLADSPHLGMLRELHLDGNLLHDAGAFALAQAPWMRRLARLHVDNCAIGDEGRRWLREALPQP